MYHPRNTVPIAVKTAGFSQAGIDHSTTVGEQRAAHFTNGENRKKWHAIWRAGRARAVAFVGAHRFPAENAEFIGN